MGTDRFRVLRRLGAGGMGVVYEVMDRDGHRLALKTLPALEPEGLLRLKNEFRNLAGLRHPNLVTLHELMAEDQQWFFTMELVEGVDFLSWLRADKLPAAGQPLSGDDTLPATVFAAMLARGSDLAVPAVARGSDLAVPPLRGTPVASPAAGRLFDEARVRPALLQLAQGLCALHEAGKVHRDVKPANILVTLESRVVLLDFGLAVETGEGGETMLHGSGVVGSVDYMAPEQAAGRPVTAAADWYSVGVVLYQALTGRLPFEGSALEVMARKQHEAPRPPRELAEVPADLAELCMSLLAIAPAARPSGADVLARLGLAQGSTRRTLTRRTRFVGRAGELAALAAARARAAVTDGAGAVAVLVSGESGVGKSALVSRFTGSLPAGTVVLAGRCYEHDAVPYKAVDGLIDALSQHLIGLGGEAAALLPRRAGLLALVFPVLGRVEAIAAAPAPRELPDPHQLRARVFVALRELFGRLAWSRPLVLVIDDLHWADPDSLRLLSEILRPPDGPPLLLIATVRGEPEAGLARALGCEVESLAVGALPPADARALAEQLLAQAGLDGASRAEAEAIAGEAAGHPLFMDALVRYASLDGHVAVTENVRLDDALWARIERLDAPARAVLALVTVAGAPLAQQVLRRAAELDPAALARVLAELRVHSLCKTSGARADDTVEAYHDRVREAAAARLDPAERRRCHRRLALAIGMRADADPEALAVHWHGAGDRERAARHYQEAAAQATAQLAFERATRLCRKALELAPPEGRRGLEVALGDALANAGRGREAADAYLAATEGAPAAEVLELRRRAADQLLRSGHIDAGLTSFRDVLAAVGMALPRTPRRALLSLLLRRARIRLRGLGFRMRDASQLSAEQLTRIDICWSAGIGLSIVDTVRGADFQTRNLLLALEAGEPYRIARALALEAGLIAAAGGRGAERAARLVTLAEELATRIGHPHAIGLAACAAGIAAHMIGQWQTAHDALLRAEALLSERCTGVTWELDNVRYFHLSSLYCLGRLADMCALVPEHLRDAAQRGDLYAATNLRLGIPNLVWLAADDPAEARRQADAAMADWSQQGFTVQHWSSLIAQGHIDLYGGDPGAALARLAAAWPALRGSQLLRVELLEHTILDLRARAAVAAAARAAGPERVRLLAQAERDATHIERAGMPWSSNLAQLVRAGVAHVRGDQPAARAHLERALAGLRTDRAEAFAVIATRRLAQLAGAAGAAAIDSADAWLTAQRIRRPDRLAALLSPGF